MNAVTPPRPAHASAPLRLDLAGGWTDVPPFSAREGGMVVNATIGLYAHASVEPGGEGIVLTSEDMNDQLRLPGLEALRARGRLALLQAALRLFPVCPSEVVTRSEAPAGSGLGSSGALDVALISALSFSRGESIERAALAHAAWRLEAVEVGMPGGKQDQYAAALGGFRSFRFNDPEVSTDVIEVDPVFAGHLERHLVLCYTGTSRVSGDTISRVMQAYERGDSTVTSALKGLKDIAAGMVEALAAADLSTVGRLLSENWTLQCRLNSGMRTPEMIRLEGAVKQAGILGAKAAGAGAGGCMFFIARGDPGEVVQAARNAGATVLPVTWVREGVRAW